MKKQHNSGRFPSSMEQQAINHMVVTDLEKKYPGHDFAVFGKKLYVDDKDIPFNYNDESLPMLTAVIGQIDKEVSKLL